MNGARAYVLDQSCDVEAAMVGQMSSQDPFAFQSPHGQLGVAELEQRELTR